MIFAHPYRCLRICATALLAAAGLLEVLPTANAGDYANVEVLGFSSDGHQFAFEQYGIQDGSGFPYSDIFIIDVATDSWVKPSPFRFTNTEAPDLADPATVTANTRHVTHQAAADAGLLQVPLYQGFTAGHNPVTELSADSHVMTVTPRLIVPPIDDPMELALEEISLPSPTCASYGADTRGFNLTLTYRGQTRVLNQDTGLPKSRGCPLRYRIDRLITFYPDGQPPVFAVLVLMETHGFEGSDGRYLAITGRI